MSRRVEYLAAFRDDAGAYRRDDLHLPRLLPAK